ncbi:MAG: D-tyrosyl-tRNA(Tyr) deacylase [Cyanobacteria bacterium]|nr:D-tyrosyl-tRNA(Tyr) deacylase [Cyanobacteriota bacterium]
MRAVVQRVLSASVTVDGEVLSRISTGMLVLAAVGKGDSEADADWLAQKLAGLRIFEDSAGKMNLDVRQAGGEILMVSQFTLFGDVRKGNRPSFDNAELPEAAYALFESLVKKTQSLGLTVKQGRFRADMKVQLVNDGPVTILLDSQKLF